MGRGKGKRGDPFRGVEFMLCSARDEKEKQHISNFHGHFSLHQQSGVWLFRNTSEDHITYINGQGFRDITLDSEETTVLWMRQNRLRFGPYQYIFQFTTPSDYIDTDGTYYAEYDSQYLKFRDPFLARAFATTW
jgi:hypothetical protein